MGFVLGVSLILPISGWSQFNDVSNQMDLFTDHTGGNWGAGMSMADFNGDGLDDLSFAHYGGVLKFFEGNGTGFTELVLNSLEATDPKVPTILFSIDSFQANDPKRQMSNNILKHSN